MRRSCRLAGTARLSWTRLCAGPARDGPVAMKPKRTRLHTQSGLSTIVRLVGRHQMFRRRPELPR